MATTLSEINAGLDEISRKNTGYSDDLKRALSLLSEVVSGLSAMPSQYADIVSATNTAGGPCGHH